MEDGKMLNTWIDSLSASFAGVQVKWTWFSQLDLFHLSFAFLFCHITCIFWYLLGSKWWHWWCYLYSCIVLCYMETLRCTTWKIWLAFQYFPGALLSLASWVDWVNILTLPGNTTSILSSCRQGHHGWTRNTR